MDRVQRTAAVAEARGPACVSGRVKLQRWPTRLVLLSLVTLLALLVGNTSSAPAFTDVPPGRLDYRAITGLAMKGAVQGFADGTFRPDSPAVRAEFVKMVVAAMFLPLGDSSQTSFRDLDPSGMRAPYPGGYVAAAYVAGIVRGKSSTVFDPYGPLTRVQAMTIAVRAAEKLRARDFKPLPAGYQGKFLDFDDPTHGENARLAEANHLLADIDLRHWNAWAPATRSEAATIAWNLVGCFG